MAYNGSGTYSAPSSSFNPAVAATDISPTDWNSLLADLSTALSTAICKDGQTVTTALIPFSSGLSTDTLSPYTASGPVSVSAGQLKFPAAQNSSANVNTLDDYEEGTFTPTIAGDGTAGAFVYTIQIGNYTKIGRQVSFTARVAYSSFSGAVGGVNINGLPVAAQTLSNDLTVVNLVADGIGYDSGYTHSLGLISSAGTVIGIYEAGSTKAIAKNGVSNLPAAGAIYITGTYFAAT